MTLADKINYYDKQMASLRAQAAKEGVQLESVNELQKRASEAERDRDDYQKALDRALAQRDEAERTFADLRNLIAVNLAANAELERRAEETETSLKLKNELYHQACDEYEVELRAAQSERDEARAALGKVVEALKRDADSLEFGGYGALAAGIRSALISYGE